MGSTRRDRAFVGRVAGAGCIAAVALAVGCDRKKTPLSASPGRVVAPDGLFDFALPGGWTEMAAPPAQTAVAVQSAIEGPGDPFRENVNVVVLPLPRAEANMPIDDLVEAGLRAANAKLPGSQISATRSLRVAGEPARQATLSFTMRGMPLRCRQTYIRHDGVFYVVSYTSVTSPKPALDAAADGLIQSWRFAD